jgi:regulatory protein
MDAKALRARALAALALREHSRAELQRKLLNAWRRADADIPEDAAARVDAVLEPLAAQGLLSEQRYLESRLRTRAPRLGARRLAAELAQQGVAATGAEWEAVLASEAERAQALLQRRFGDEPPPDDKELARRMRFLVSRGFAPALALKLVKGNRR